MKMREICLSRTVGDLVGTVQVVTDILWGIGGLLDVDILKSEARARSLFRTINADDGLLTSYRAIETALVNSAF